MSSSDEKATPRKGLGWFPKLILWAAVFAFGYVYLSSVDREDGGIREGSMLDTLAKLSPVSLESLGLANKEEGQAAAEQTQAPATSQPTAKAETDRPAGSSEPAKTPAPSETSASSKISAPPAESAPRPLPPPINYEALAVKPTPKPVEQPTAAVAPSPSAATAVQVPTVVQQAPVAEAPQPRTESPGVAAASVPPAASAPSAPAPMPEQVPFVPQPSATGSQDDWASLHQQRRAEMMARYEAMRREAEERMRRQWEERRQSMPPVYPPYPYPGYGPGYWPGYAPGVYGPGR